MKSKIWQVHVKDEKYTGESRQILVRGKSAGDAEKKALTIYQRETDPESGSRPFAQNVELVGTLEE